MKNSAHGADESKNGVELAARLFLLNFQIEDEKNI